jgi:hypothetical protein
LVKPGQQLVLDEVVVERILLIPEGRTETNVAWNAREFRLDRLLDQALPERTGAICRKAGTEGRGSHRP